APCGILARHPHDQLPDLGEHAATTRPKRRTRPLPRDELAMPPEQRIGCHNCGDLAQRPTAHPKGPHREPPSVVLGQAQTPPAQLPAQEAVLFDQIRERLPLSALEPAGEDRSSIWRVAGSITS